MHKKITIILILLVTILLIGWDIVVATNGIAGDTISAIIYEISKKFLVVPLAFGAIAGHFFWPIQEMKTWKAMWTPLIIIGIGCLVWDLARQTELSTVWTASALIAGIIIGHYLWPNRGKDGV